MTRTLPMITFALSLAACGGEAPTEPQAPDASVATIDAGHAPHDAGVDPCEDGVLSPGEAGVDCGRACGVPCPLDTPCAAQEDCDLSQGARCLDPRGTGERECTPTEVSCLALDCAEGTYCKLAARVLGSQSPLGDRVYCTAENAAGDTCQAPPLHYEDLDPCAAGYYCRRTGPGDAQCAAQTPGGDRCGDRGAASCEDGYACDADLFGDPMDCRPQSDRNGTCLNHWDCLPGLACHRSRCQPRSPVGGPCTANGRACSGSVCVRTSPDCDFPLICDVGADLSQTEGVCAPNPQ